MGKKIDYKRLIIEAKKQGISRYVVGAVIVKNSKILLLKRHKDDFMGRIYELPSGKVEEEEGLSAALKREVEEETGLKIKKIVRCLGYFDYDSKSGKRTRQFNFEIFVLEPTNIILSEHDDFVWLNREELQNYHVTENVKEILNSFWGKR